MAKKSKEKPIRMKKVSRTVKQYSLPINDAEFEEIKLIAKRYRKLKNYVYSRYSSVNSLILLKNYRKEIRDIWVENKFAQQWKLPARYWKLALDEAISSIKSLWSNAKNAVKKALRANSNVTEDEKHYIYYVLKADELLHSILTRKAFTKPKKIRELAIREKYVHHLIRRYIRKYKGSTPYSHKETVFSIDADMYRYVTKDGSLFVEMTSTKPRKRVRIPLRDQNRYGGNIRIIIKSEELNELELHHYVQTKQRRIWKDGNVIGIDKGYKTLIASSSGNLYGENLNELLTKETERLNGKNKRRNQYWALAKKYEAEGQVEKAQRIWKHNFGKKKYHRLKEKHDAAVKSYINYSLNQFFLLERPSIVISEDLSFASWKKKFPKLIKRKLSRWIKGYIKERIEFKCEVWDVHYQLVNSAYTSQVCHSCGEFGKREGDVYTCSTCGSTHADLNASINIKLRKDDPKINLYTPYKEVKKIIEERIKEKLSS